MSDVPLADPDFLRALVRARMPFGRFKGQRLARLPEEYLVWFAQRGFPRGKLGRQMASLYEIYANGLGGVLRPLVEAAEREEAIEESGSSPR